MGVKIRNYRRLTDNSYELSVLRGEATRVAECIGKIKKAFGKVTTELGFSLRTDPRTDAFAEMEKGRDKIGNEHKNC